MKQLIVDASSVKIEFDNLQMHILYPNRLEYRELNVTDRLEMMYQKF